MLKKILAVEDLQHKQDEWRSALNGRVDFLSALTIKEAIELFDNNPDVDVVVMDACVPGDTPTTQGLIRKIRETFKGPMIACSSDSSYRRLLMSCGCDHQALKDDVPTKVLEVLGL